MKFQLSCLYRQIWGIPFVAIFVFLFALTATGVTYLIVEKQGEALAKMRLETYKQLLVSHVSHHLDDYAHVLHGAAGLFNASEEVTREEWKHYVSSLSLQKYYPSIELMGYVAAKSTDKFATLAYEEATHPLSEAVFRPDSSSENPRNDAMKTALEQNNVTMTKKLVLVEGAHGQKQLGFLMLFPVYQKGMRLETLEDRKNALQGYVYSVFRSQNFLKEVTKLFDEYLEVHVYDSAEPHAKDLIYKNVSKNEAEAVYKKYNTSSQLLVGDQVWSISAWLKNQAEGLVKSEGAQNIWVFGIIMSVLFFVLTWMLVVYRFQLTEISKKSISIKTLPKGRNQQLFLVKIFHELRTPIHNVLALTRIMSENKDHNLTSIQVDQLGMIHRSGEELIETIDEVMNFSKIQSGKMSLKMSKIYLSDFSGEIQHKFECMAKEKSLQFHVEVDSSLPPVIYSDHKKIYQIVKNLCINAIKYTDKGSISVRFYRPAMADAMAIAVKDTGHGVSKEKLESIFEAFNQDESVPPSALGGSGLGLAISQDLADLLGGEITLESQVQQGSCFTLYIPINSALTGEQ